VLETSSWDREHHLIEIVFLGSERDRGAQPQRREKGLLPSFVPLHELHKVGLQPPIAGYIRGLVRDPRRTAAYLGNVWRPEVIPLAQGETDESDSR
jgi:hypothetical protein